ncbi:MAG: citrate (Si)-synthase, partial [Saprospiraceae bacterium]|nr:citrate (Si)-synthase [Saprospiraceae bacterium]
MDLLKSKFSQKASALQKEIKTILRENGDRKIDQVTLSQLFGGARGIKMMVWETSNLDPIDGIRFRGYSIPQLRDQLPKGPDGKEPLPEGLFWLMLVGEIPTADEVKWLAEQWVSRSNVPEHVFRTLDAMPTDTHPMTQFIVAITAMQASS